MMAKTREYRGIVQKVEPNGNHGPYAKARVEKLGSVTFSLDPSVWREAKLPEEGDMVVMIDIHKKRAGWKAEQCRFLRPEDEEATATAESNPTTDERKGLHNA